ncbi:MAG: LysR substrate-binding domain-containing protein, partial [Pseudomonadota bacterium]
MSLPMLEVVLKGWVTETKLTEWRSKVATIRAQGALSKPGDLLDEDLISLAGPYRPEARWPHWFRRMGVETPGLTPGATMNTYITMVQAAVEGQGIALAGSPLVDTLIETGSLVTLPEEFA